MSIRDGGRLPHRRILTGSDLMKCGDREREKGYNVLIKTELSGLKVRDPSCPKGKKLRKK